MNEQTQTDKHRHTHNSLCRYINELNLNTKIDIKTAFTRKTRDYHEQTNIKTNNKYTATVIVTSQIRLDYRYAVLQFTYFYFHYCGPVQFIFVQLITSFFFSFPGHCVQ